jgi:hypothetical protein
MNGCASNGFGGDPQGEQQRLRLLVMPGGNNPVMQGGAMSALAFQLCKPAYVIVSGNTSALIQVASQTFANQKNGDD